MADKLLTFEDAKKQNTCNLDGRAKDFSKQSFWHYTKIKTLDKIFNREDKNGYALLCSKLKGVNDSDEQKRENSDNVFLTCFCNSNSEKIPMWYLYGSITGNSAALGITPANMMKFLKSIDYVYGVKGESRDTIHIGDSLKIDYGWVYYVKKEREKTKFYLRREFYEITDFDRKCNDYYFLKNYVWNYEKEFRIVITDVANRGYDEILLPIPAEIARQMKLVVKQKSLIDNKTLPMDKDKIKESALGSEIDLLGRNRDEVLEYAKDHICHCRNGAPNKKTIENG